MEEETPSQRLVNVYVPASLPVNVSVQHRSLFSATCAKDISVPVPDIDTGFSNSVSVPVQPSTDNMPAFKPMEDLQAEPSVSPNPANFPVSPQRPEDLIPEGEPEPTEEPSPATPDSDAKTLSSGESSEDDEKATPEKGGQTASILPSSVLDRASAIAQHFTNSIKRGSPSQEAAPSLGCCSPRLPSRTNSSLSLIAEPTDGAVQLNSICSDLTEVFNATDLTPPPEDSSFDASRSIHRRRESTLSKQDQLLIGKIKNYYENAGNQDVSWSLQRRESLTYIPTGLVQSSISRLNSIHTDVSTSSSLELHSTLVTELTVSTESLDSQGSEQRSTGPEVPGESLISKSKDLRSNQLEDEQFRPSSEMIRIWQEMERDISVTQCEDRGDEESKEASGNTNAAAFIQTTSLSGADLGSTEDSTNTSLANLAGSLKNTLKVFGAVSFKVPVPRVAQLKAEAEERRPSGNQEDVDRSKSKVLHLARQYSQRIKTSSPVVRQRSQGFLLSKKSLPCVVEEETSGTLTEIQTKSGEHLCVGAQLCFAFSSC